MIHHVTPKPVPCCVTARVAFVQGQALPEDVARLFFQQIVVAIDYSHRMGVANRDIKLDNILLHRQVRTAPLYAFPLPSVNATSALCWPDARILMETTTVVAGYSQATTG